MNLQQLNSLPQADAERWFAQTCAAQKWITGMVKKRPHNSLQDLNSNAQAVWQTCNMEDYLQAFEAHPMIGDVDSLREKFASTKTLASKEQSGANNASEQTLNELSELNHLYLQRNDFIFIICASGLSAEAMLNALKLRISNSHAVELEKAAAEQIKITLLRLQKGLNENP
jgi:2-oxo-4-hydroxy-4-carboxy-5-ureidoimidazoline decarboxylase